MAINTRGWCRKSIDGRRTVNKMATVGGSMKLLIVNVGELTVVVQ